MTPTKPRSRGTKIKNKDKKVLVAPLKESVFYARMSKKKGGGASRRGSHRMANAGGCEVRWHWAHWAKLQSTRGNFYMDYGTLVHTCLAYHYAEKMARKPKWFLEQPNVEDQMVKDAEGNPAWLRSVADLMEAYKRHYDSDPWNPLYNEEEFEATIEDIDPDGEDEPAATYEYRGSCTGTVDATDQPCINLDSDGNHVPHVTDRLLKLPRLNEEIVTCRPDLIVEKNGSLYIIDHKTAGGKRDGSGRLPVIDERYPDYQYYWQAMVNLHVVRKGRCADVPGVERLHIKGFEFNRVKRDIPFDFSRDPFQMPARQYAKIPTSIRDCIRRERQLAIKSAFAPKTLIAHPWECEGKYKCDFVRVCHVDTIEERNVIIATEYTQG